MNSYLLNRQLGSISPSAFATAQNDRLVRSIQAAPEVRFSLAHTYSNGGDEVDTGGRRPHPAGVNSIDIDRFEGRYLLSAGADSSISLWDLESADLTHPNRYTPSIYSARTAKQSPLAISHVSFYPFDSLAFLTSSPSGTLSLFSSETLQSSASFRLISPVHSHATSNISTHLLVACATSHPAVRLVDLNSGNMTHSLPGHYGSVLSVSWHPRHEHILASSSSSGEVRLWDVRRSASSLGVLEMEDSIGLAGYDGIGTGARGRERGKAHNGACNGVVWTQDGRWIVSAGLDERIRVWDARTGANTLVHFGAGVRNRTTNVLRPLVAPRSVSVGGREVLFWPNPKEVLMFEMFTGKLLRRMKVVETVEQRRSAGVGGSAVARTTSLAGRAGRVEMFSGHADGEVRCWRPRTSEDQLADEEGKEEDEDDKGTADRKRKREDLEKIVRDLTGRTVTYS